MKLRFIGLTLALLLPAFNGCSKKSNSQPALPKSVDLGVVELSYNTASRHDLGDKMVCVLMAQPMDAANIEVTADLEKDGKNIGSARALPVLIGRPLDLSFGNVAVRLTPKVN